MTEAQRKRLNEIVFVQYVDSTLKRVSNPSRLYILMDTICEMYGGNSLLLRKAVSEVLCRRDMYKAGQQEIRALAHHTKAPLQRVLKLLGVSRATYYRSNNDEMIKQPQFEQEYYSEVEEFLKFLKETLDVLELGGLLDEPETVIKEFD